MQRDAALGDAMPTLSVTIIAKNEERNLPRLLASVCEIADEIIVTWLDHDSNIAPWLALEERGVVVRHVDFNPAGCTLDMAGL